MLLNLSNPMIGGSVSPSRREKSSCERSTRPSSVVEEASGESKPIVTGEAEVEEEHSISKEGKAGVTVGLVVDKAGLELLTESTKLSEPLETYAA